MSNWLQNALEIMDGEPILPSSDPFGPARTAPASQYEDEPLDDTQQPVDQAQLADDGSVFLRGLKSGALNTAGLPFYLGAQALDMVGLDNAAEPIYDMAAPIVEQAQQYAPRVSFEQMVDEFSPIENPLQTAKNIWYQTRYQAGSLLPSMATGLTGAAIGRAVVQKAATKNILKKAIEKRAGKLAQKKAFTDMAEDKLKTIAAQRMGVQYGIMGAVAPMESGHMYAADVERRGVHAANPYLPAALGIAAGAVETMFGGGALNAIYKVFGKEAAEATVKELALNNIRPVLNILKEAILQSKGEALQEMTQEGLAILNDLWTTPEGQSIPGSDIALRLGESAFAGLVGGSGPGAVTGAISSIRARSNKGGEDLGGKGQTDTVPNLDAIRQKMEEESAKRDQEQAEAEAEAEGGQAPEGPYPEQPPPVTPQPGAPVQEEIPVGPSPQGPSVNMTMAVQTFEALGISPQYIEESGNDITVTLPENVLGLSRKQIQTLEEAYWVKTTGIEINGKPTTTVTLTPKGVDQAPVTDREPPDDYVRVYPQGTQPPEPGPVPPDPRDLGPGPPGPLGPEPPPIPPGTQPGPVPEGPAPQGVKYTDPAGREWSIDEDKQKQLYLDLFTAGSQQEGIGPSKNDLSEQVGLTMDNYRDEGVPDADLQQMWDVVKADLIDMAWPAPPPTDVTPKQEQLPAPAAPVQPETFVPKTPKPSKVRTLRGYFVKMSKGVGIDFLNFKGELKDMPLWVKKMSKKGGIKIDDAVMQAQEEGWLGEDEGVSEMLELFRTDQAKRRNLLEQGANVPDRELTPQEKHYQDTLEYEPEEPPPGDYVQMNAMDLPEGKTMTIIDGNGMDGWDIYTVVDKDPFGITLQDGQKIELKPHEKVDVLATDLEQKAAPKKPKTGTDFSMDKGALIQQAMDMDIPVTIGKDGNPTGGFTWESLQQTVNTGKRVQPEQPPPKAPKGQADLFSGEADQVQTGMFGRGFKPKPTVPPVAEKVEEPAPGPAIETGLWHDETPDKYHESALKDDLNIRALKRIAQLEEKVSKLGKRGSETSYERSLRDHAGAVTGSRVRYMNSLTAKARGYKRHDEARLERARKTLEDKIAIEPDAPQFSPPVETGETGVDWDHPTAATSDGKPRKVKFYQEKDGIGSGLMYDYANKRPSYWLAQGRNAAQYGSGSTRQEAIDEAVKSLEQSDKIDHTRRTKQYTEDELNEMHMRKVRDIARLRGIDGWAKKQRKTLTKLIMLDSAKRKAKAPGAAPAPQIGKARQDKIDEIARLARRKMPRIVPVYEVKGTDGKWHRGTGMPGGVDSTGERRLEGYIFNSRGSNIGQSEKTKEALIERWESTENKNAEDMKKALESRTDKDLDSQLDYWHKEAQRKSAEPLDYAYIRLNMTPGDGSWDRSTVKNYAKTFIRPLDKRMVGWKSTQLLSTKKWSAGKDLSALAKAGIIQRAWDAGGNPHYAKLGVKMPDGLYTSEQMDKIEAGELKPPPVKTTPVQAPPVRKAEKTQAAEAGTGKIKNRWSTELSDAQVKELDRIYNGMKDVGREGEVRYYTHKMAGGYVFVENTTTGATAAIDQRAHSHEVAKDTPFERVISHEFEDRRDYFEHEDHIAAREAREQSAKKMGVEAKRRDAAPRIFSITNVTGGLTTFKRENGKWYRRTGKRPWTRHTYHKNFPSENELEIDFNRGNLDKKEISTWPNRPIGKLLGGLERKSAGGVAIPKIHRNEVENELYEATKGMIPVYEKTVTEKDGKYHIERPGPNLVYDPDTGVLAQVPDKRKKIKLTSKSSLLEGEDSFTGEIDAEMTVDKENIAPVLSKDVADQDPPKTLVNELMQNALDAVIKNKVGDRNIDITIDLDLKTDLYELTISDNGSGMTRQEIRDNFLPIGTEGKPGTDTMGGYGFAKTAFLLIPDKIELKTTKGKTTSFLTGTRDNFLYGEQKIPYRPRKPGEKGTTIKLYLPNDFNAYMMKIKFKEFFKKLRTKPINVNYKHIVDDRIKMTTKTFTKDAQVAAPKTFSYKGNTGKMYFIAAPAYGYKWDGEYGVEGVIYNKGLPLAIGNSALELMSLPEQPTYRVHVDFTKTTGVRDDNYPFLKNRTIINQDVARHVKGIADAEILRMAKKKFKAKKGELQDMIQKAPKVAGIDILIPFKEQKDIDKAVKVFNKNKPLFEDIGRLYAKFTRALTNAGEEGVHFAITVDPKVHGFRTVPESTGHEIYVINPFSVSQKLLDTKLYQRFVKAGGDTKLLQADNFVHTLVHEYAHKTEEEHSEAFAQHLGILYSKLGHRTLARLANEFYENVYDRHESAIERIGKNLENLGKGGSRFQKNSAILQSSRPYRHGETGVSGLGEQEHLKLTSNSGIFSMLGNNRGEAGDINDAGRAAQRHLRQPPDPALRGVMGLGHIHLPNDELQLWKRIVGNPYWIGRSKKYASTYGAAVKAASDTQETRSKMNHDDMVRDAKPLMSLENKDMPELQDLTWNILEGKPFPEDANIPEKFERDEDGFLHQVDDHYTQMQRWLGEIGVTRPVQKAYVAMRRLLDKKLIDLDNLLNEYAEKVPPEVISDHRKALGEIHNYFPHLRHGNMKAMVFDPATEKLIYEEHFPTVAGFNLKGNTPRLTGILLKWARDNGHEHITANDIKIEKVTQLPDSTFFDVNVQAMEQIIEAAVKKTETRDDTALRAYGVTPTSDEIRTTLAKAIAEVLQLRGFGAHMIGRKDIPGFETHDIKGALFEYITSANGFITKMHKAQEYAGILRKIDAQKTPGLFKSLSKFVRDDLSNADGVDRSVDKLRALLFVKYLGAVPKSGVVNLTQNFIAAWPRLTVWENEDGSTESIKWAMPTLLRSMKDSTRIMKVILKKGDITQVTGLPRHELAALKHGFVNGHFVDQYLRELSASATITSKAGKKFMKVMGMPMQLAEVYNRVSTYLAGYRIARKKLGGDLTGAALEKAAMDHAEQATIDAHFMYAKHNLPEWARGSWGGKTARAMYTFRSFSHNYAGLTQWLWKQGTPGKKAVMKSLFSMWALGGLLSMPFYDDWGELYRKMFDEDPATLARRKIKNPLLKDVMTFGLTGLGGVDLHGSLGMELPTSITELFGVPYAIIEDSIRMNDFYQIDDYSRMIESSPVTPMVVRNAMAGYRMATEGAYTKTGKPIGDIVGGKVEPRKLTTAEFVRKSFGFQPTTNTKSYSAYEGLRKSIESHNKKKSILATRFINALREKDKKAIASIRKEIFKWNTTTGKSKPHLRIDIRRLIKTRRTASKPPKQFRRHAQQLRQAWE